MHFDQFDPAKSAMGSYLVVKDLGMMFVASPGVRMDSNLNQSGIHGKANFSVDVAILTGIAAMMNESGAVIPIKVDTKYHAKGGGLQKFP